MITLETTLAIFKKFNEGMRVKDIACLFDMTATTVVTIKKDKGNVQLDETPRNAMEHFAWENPPRQALSKKAVTDRGDGVWRHSVDKHEASSFFLKMSLHAAVTPAASSTGSSTSSCATLVQ